MVVDVEKRLEAAPTCSDAPESRIFEDDPPWSTTRTCQDHSTYAAMVESTDESVGALIDALARLNLDDRTAIVFVSDNGGLSTLMRGRKSAPTSNKPLRAGKGYLYEGGVRIPFIIHDPDTQVTGVRSAPGSTVDVVPTLLDLAGLEVPVADGLSLLSEARYAGTLSERPLYFHFPHYHGSGNRPSGSVRAGRYKLLEWFETSEIELYDLEFDPGERTNLAANQPEIADSLLTMMQNWRREVDAQMPESNPDWEND